MNGWQTITIGNALKLKSGDFLSATNMDSSGKYPVYGGNGINGYHTKYMFRESKIVLGRVGAYCGVVHRTQPYSWITDNALYVAEKDSRFDDDFLEIALRHADLHQYASQSGQPLISQTKIKDVVLPLPSLEEQQRIAGILARADRLRQLRRYALQLSEGYLQSVFLEMFGDPVTNPMGWEITNLGAVCKVIRDGVHKTPDYVSNGIPFITVKNIVSGKVSFEDTKFITPEEHSILTKRVKPEQEDILVSKDGSIGIPCVVDTNKEFSIFVSVALLKLHRHLVKPQFLAEQLRSEALQKQIREGTKGIAIRHLHLGDFKKLKILRPSLQEQERFETVLQQYERLRSQQQEAARQADHLFATLLHRAFVGEL